MLVGLLAARNAGIEVPDEAIDRAISYYVSMTSTSGEVGYSGLGGFGESLPRSSIATLVFALARRKDLSQFKSALAHLVERIETTGQNGGHLDYQRHYQAQDLFQGDVEVWKKWNQVLSRQLQSTTIARWQLPGPVRSRVPPLTLLAVALNFDSCPIYER